MRYLVTAFGSSALTILTLGIWGLFDQRRNREQAEILEREESAALVGKGGCLYWCACSCNQAGCGCHG